MMVSKIQQVFWKIMVWGNCRSAVNFYKVPKLDYDLAIFMLLMYLDIDIPGP